MLYCADTMTIFLVLLRKIVSNGFSTGATPLATAPEYGAQRKVIRYVHQYQNRRFIRHDERS